MIDPKLVQRWKARLDTWCGQPVDVAESVVEMICEIRQEMDGELDREFERQREGECTQRLASPWVIAVKEAIGCAQLSPCRSQRGVAIFRDKVILGHGNNFKPSGFACDGSLACKATCRREAVHAEQMALLSAGLTTHGADLVHVKVVDQTLVATGGPSCVECSKLIVAMGIRFVWLFEDAGWQRYAADDFHRRSLAAQTRG